MRHRCVTLQALVGPGHMIILVDELLQQPFQMTVPEEILGLQAKGHRFAQLLEDPIQARMSGHGKAYDLTSTVIEDEEDIQRGEVKRGDREEIDGPGYVHVIAYKGGIVKCCGW